MRAAIAVVESTRFCVRFSTVVPSSFLDQQVNVVDAQGRELLVRTLKIKQQASERNIDLTAHN